MAATMTSRAKVVVCDNGTGFVVRVRGDNFPRGVPVHGREAHAAMRRRCRTRS